ncbi:MAG: transcriptional repressor [Rhodobacteraceae bacterium]|nr:transcriptional repressor [Paracoccaceae bacterium]MCW9043404.1 transcriptional repressor [Pseudopelagicola sp.]
MHDLGFAQHDHAACVATALSTAEATCAAQKLQLTPTRRRVLEILLEEHRAMGAYDILAVLSSEGIGSQPPVVYRALDFLVSNGFAHKIEKRNAYLACAHPGEDHSPVFLICRACDTVAEATLPMADLRRAADETGFLIETTVIEIEGLCPDCRKAA